MNQSGSQAVLPQLTIKAVVLGILLAMVLAGANAYLGLFAGLTVSASIPAAVISMGVLRLFKNSNILENNIVQTAASAGESLAAGVIFTLPALILLGYWDSFDYLQVTVIAGLGGVLGVFFTIPLRRSLIVERGLTFPEGVATAEVLKIGDQGASRGLKLLAVASVVGGVVKLAEAGVRLWPGTAEAAAWMGKGIAYIGTNLSPALLAVGYIVRLNIAVLVFVGGGLAWFVGIPLYAVFLGAEDPALAGITDAAAAAGTIWSTQIRYVGVGAMLLGGVWALISMRKSLLDGITGGLKEMRRDSNEVIDHTEQDTPMKFVLLAIVLLVIPIFVLYQSVVQKFGISLSMAVLMVVAGFLFSSVAGYMAGLVGSSNNPISGITIATITLASFLLLLLLGKDAQNGPAAAIMVGAVVCCAAAIAGDNMQDLKAGYILGATPWRQQVMQMVGTLASAMVIAPILMVLLEAYGFGPATAEHPNSLQAPQATLMASVAQGVFGANLPWNMIFIGVGVAAVVIFIDLMLERRGSSFRAPVLAVAVGIYLPLELSVPIFAGGLIAAFSEKVGGGPEGAGRRMGVLVAAGLITGEALMGILIAILLVSLDNPGDLALFNNPWEYWPGLAAMVLIGIWTYRIASGRGEPKEDG